MGCKLKSSLECLNIVQGALSVAPTGRQCPVVGVRLGPIRTCRRAMKHFWSFVSTACKGGGGVPDEHCGR